MTERILYLLMVVAIGWAVTFGLRSLPFLLFAGRDRALPPWVERLGNVISPVIIGGLIVYSYSGLEWKTLWPYLAGVLTVGLQVWKRNPLVSIISGTVLYMCLLSCGCTTRQALELNAEKPAVRMSNQGVLFGDTFVEPTEVPKILEDYDIPHDRVIHILLDPDVKDLTPARNLMGCLAHAGYTRPVLVTKEHGVSSNKSGNSYAGSERMERRSDVDFYVTSKGVRLGLLMSVLPNEVLPCLKDLNVGHEQLIRLNYFASEGDSPARRENFEIIEGILRKGGYTNVVRWDVEKARARRSTNQPVRSAGVKQGDSTDGRTKRVIRYKRADE